MMPDFGALNARQLPPNCMRAIEMLRFLFAICNYDDLDPTVKSHARKLLARQQCAEASLQRLEIELGFRKSPRISKKRQAKGKRKATRSSVLLPPSYGGVNES